MKKVMTIILSLVMALSGISGLAQGTTERPTSTGALLLSAKPEITIEYDAKGKVIGIAARNNEAFAIIASCENLIGQETRKVMAELVTAIGNAGYFEKEAKKDDDEITIEILKGSKQPHEGFMDEVYEEVRTTVRTNKWRVPVDVENEEEFGLPEYKDDDYDDDDFHDDFEDDFEEEDDKKSEKKD